MQSTMRNQPQITDARKIKLSPGELAFMASVLEEAGGPITTGTAISFDPTEVRAVCGLAKKGLIVRQQGEVEVTELGAAWFHNVEQAWEAAWERTVVESRAEARRSLEAAASEQPNLMKMTPNQDQRVLDDLESGDLTKSGEGAVVLEWDRKTGIWRQQRQTKAEQMLALPYEKRIRKLVWALFFPSVICLGLVAGISLAAYALAL